MASSKSPGILEIIIVNVKRSPAHQQSRHVHHRAQRVDCRLTETRVRSDSIFAALQSSFRQTPTFQRVLNFAPMQILFRLVGCASSCSVWVWHFKCSCSTGTEFMISTQYIMAQGNWNRMWWIKHVSNKSRPRNR